MLHFFNRHRLVKQDDRLHAFDYFQIALVALSLAFVLKLYVVDAVVIPSPSMEQTLHVGDYVLVNKLVGGLSSSRARHDEAGFPYFGAGRSIERGEVVVFEFPSNEHCAKSAEHAVFVKRCIARSGDTVTIRNGSVVVNNIRIPSYSSDVFTHEQRNVQDDFGTVVVPQPGQVISLSQENYHDWETFIRREGHIIENIPSMGVFIDGRLTSNYSIEKNYLFVLGDNRSHSFDSRSWGFLPKENVIGKATMIYWSSDPSSHLRTVWDYLSSIRWNRIGTFVQ